MAVGSAQPQAACKVLHVVPTFYPATYWGGPIYSVLGLCNALVSDGEVSLKVLTTDSAGPRLSERLPAGQMPARLAAGTRDYEVFYCRRNLGHSVSLSMMTRLWGMVRDAQVVHLTAVYSPPTIPTLLVCRLLGRPVVWSPRGALQRWEGTARPWAKLLWERICGALIDRRRLVLHATSDEEATESLARIPRLRTVIIPNGVEIPAELAPRTWLPDGKARLLYIGRLHPKKGIENLLEALKQMGGRVASLVICGGGDPAYAASLRQKAAELGLAGAVEFRGQVDGAEKTRAFIEADVCVVPSFTENFAMVVAEALAHGVPVIASRGTPWEGLAGRDCGLWVDNSPQALAQAVFDILGQDLPAMGGRGRAWMLEAFSWRAVAHKMVAVYAELIAQRDSRSSRNVG